MSITYEAVLDVSERSVQFLSKLLHEERVRRGTRKDTRALGTHKQAVLILRWFLDDTRMTQLARDNGINTSTAHDYRDEGIAVLAARKPSLHGALLAAKAAGYTHVIVDQDQQAFNAVHSALRCLGERADSLLKTTYKALRRQRGCPRQISKIAAAALVLLHLEHDRTT